MQFFLYFCLFFTFFNLVSFSQETGRPKNIILLIGDGMGLNYVSASVISLSNNPYKKFQSVGLSITCSADKLITDSAAGATAISTGHRTNNYSLAVDTSNKPLLTIFELAESLGMSTGLVVTSSITHATPAAFISHVNNRKEEYEIAKQISDSNIDVVIGGGRKFFNSGGNENLIGKIIDNGYNYFEDVNKILNDPIEKKFYALLEKEGLNKAGNRNYTLGELTKAAISNLNQNKNGFILMIEGSQIDWAAHDNLTENVFLELEDFNTAINTALDFAEKDGNTLVVVTADHETGGMAITGGELNDKRLKLSYSTTGHSAEMVGVFAKGPGEELFRGVFENFMTGRKLFSLVDKNFIF
jgi:alkaline phosphatase